MTRRIRCARRDYRARKLGQWEKYGMYHSPGLYPWWRLAYTDTMYMDSLLVDRKAERTRQPFFWFWRYRCSWEHAVVNATLFGFSLHRSPVLCIYANVQQARNSIGEEKGRDREGEREKAYPTNVWFLARILNGTSTFRDKSLRSFERSSRESSARLSKNHLHATVINRDRLEEKGRKTQELDLHFFVTSKIIYVVILLCHECFTMIFEIEIYNRSNSYNLECFGRIQIIINIKFNQDNISYDDTYIIFLNIIRYLRDSENRFIYKTWIRLG